MHTQDPSEFHSTNAAHTNVFASRSSTFFASWSSTNLRVLSRNPSTMPCSVLYDICMTRWYTWNHCTVDTLEMTCSGIWITTVNVNFVTARRLYDPLVVVLLHVHPVHQVRLTTSDHTNSCSACEWVRLPLLSPWNSIIPSFKVLLHGNVESLSTTFQILYI